MGRLIDADKWIEKLNAIISDEEAPSEIKDHAMFLISEISAESTAYDVEKVVAELELSAEGAKDSKNLSKYSAYKQATEIVRKGGIDG